MLLASSALALGFLHGLGADHLMAITALSVNAGGTTEAPPARAFKVAVRFACGHAILLTVGATLAVVAGWQIPVIVERGGEVVGGGLLVLLGGAGLWAAATGRVYAHSHLHGDPSHSHWHLHVGMPHRHPSPSAHSHLPTLLGAVFAISGLRALGLLMPFGGAETVGGSLLTLLPLIAIFAVGILLSMGLFGVVLAHVLSRQARTHVSRVAAVTTAAASIGLGIYWISAV